MAVPSRKPGFTGHSSDSQQEGGIKMEELEDILQESKIDWSDAQKQQAAEDLNEIQGKTKKLISKANMTARSLRLLADKLDVVWKDCKTAHAIGTGVSVAGGLLIIGATYVTGGLATPWLVLGMAAGGAGAVTNLAAGRIEASINSKELEKVQKDLRETLEYVNIVNDTIREWQDAKEVGRLLCIFSLALHTLNITDPVIKMLQKMISRSPIMKFSVDFLKEKFKVMETAFTKLVGQAAAGAADDVASAALKTGGQAADDVVGAGVKTGANASKVAGGVITALFLVWDTIDLGFTIRDLIEERGSEAAKDLREIAYQLDKECSFD